MFTRNLLILAVFSPAAVFTAAAPLLTMAVVALLFVHRARAGTDHTLAEIHLESPVSIRRVLSFAALLLIILVFATLSERYFGKFGFLGSSALGGLVSSASTSAAAANMVGHGKMQPGLAGEGVVLASIASALVNLPIIHRNAKNPSLSRQLAMLTVVLSAIGTAVLVFQEYMWPATR
jgi:uncharacterized membrane protein (DUF4010 family)